MFSTRPYPKESTISGLTPSNLYKAGEWASLLLGGGRLAYAGLAKGSSMLLAADGATVANSMAAVSVRNGLKVAFRLGLNNTARVYSYAEMATKYGPPGAIIAAAGRTSSFYNGMGALAAAGGLSGLESGCGKQ